MRMKVVWFNHWFSTAYRIIELLKKGEEYISVIGTSTNKYMVYKDVCDRFEVEPDFGGDMEGYIAWCLDFCKRNSVDVFFPKKNLLAISKAKADFESAGVKVIVSGNTELLEKLDDKEATFEYLKGYETVGKIPERYVVTTKEEFLKAYSSLKREGNRVCIKYVHDEGAKSFRVIDDKMYSIASLDKPQGAKVSLADILVILGDVKEFKPLMVMEFMEGLEISVDCLATSQGFIAIPRKKLGGRVTHVDMAQEYCDRAKAFYDLTKLDCPFNIQFKYHKGELYVLEVNTRMSGGVHLSCMSGVNIPQIALRDALGLEFVTPQKESLVSLKVAHVETPIRVG